MNLKLTLVVVAALTALGVWLLLKADSAGVGTAAVVDSWQDDIDFKNRADFSLRIGALRDQIKQNAAMGMDDEDHIHQELDQITAIGQEIEAARAQFAKDGKSKPAITAWVNSTGWSGLSALADSLRAKLPAASP